MEKADCADYSSFSQEAIQKSLEEMIADVKKKTGASDAEITIAFYEAALRVMETNFLAL